MPSPGLLTRWSGPRFLCLLAVRVMVVAATVSKGCEAPGKPKCFRDNSSSHKYTCEWERSSSATHVTYDLLFNTTEPPFHVVNEMSWRDLPTNRIYLDEDQLIKNRKVSIVVTAHAGNASCTSNSTTVVLSTVVKLPEPVIMAALWSDQKLKLTRPSQGDSASAEVLARPVENKTQTWSHEVKKETNVLKPLPPVLNLVECSSRSCNITWRHSLKPHLQVQYSDVTDQMVAEEECIPLPDSDWQNSSSELPSVHSLEPSRHYCFRARAKLNSGLWSDWSRPVHNRTQGEEKTNLLYWLLLATFLCIALLLCHFKLITRWQRLKTIRISLNDVPDPSNSKWAKAFTDNKTFVDSLKSKMDLNVNPSDFSSSEEVDIVTFLENPKEIVEDLGHREGLTDASSVHRPDWDSGTASQTHYIKSTDSSHYVRSSQDTGYTASYISSQAEQSVLVEGREEEEECIDFYSSKVFDEPIVFGRGLTLNAVKIDGRSLWENDC
ncbi:unnamed protein product [Gadus morhua 'NCC']